MKKPCLSKDQFLKNFEEPRASGLIANITSPRVRMTGLHSVVIADETSAKTSRADKNRCWKIHLQFFIVKII